MGAGDSGLNHLPLFAVLYRYDKLRNYGLTYELPCFLEYSYFAELV